MTDLYQLTMAFGYFKSNRHEQPVVFHYSFRRQPFSGGFTIFAGLSCLLNIIKEYRVTEDEIEYLKTLTSEDGYVLFDTSFLSYLKNFKFRCHIDAAPEGSVVFPYEPIVRVYGSLMECQLLETVLLNILNFQTLITTKAARICLAAGSDPVFEFGLRRAQGIDGALSASKAAYIGGCAATSNVLAGKLFHIPVAGTLSHSWVMAFDSELKAFEAYAEALPSHCTFLIDTYDTYHGVQNAIKIGKRLQKKGKKLLGVRLDSGDLAYLSIEVRKELDRAGFVETKIVASNELDEILITDLKRQGAKIDAWGVGTHLVTAKGDSALDGVYKLGAVQDKQGQWQYKIKVSEQLAKTSTPGFLQVKRFLKEGLLLADMIYDELSEKKAETIHLIHPNDPSKQKVISHDIQGYDLLIPVFQEGESLIEEDGIQQARNRCAEEIEKLDASYKRFINSHEYFVGLEKSLYREKMRLIAQFKGYKSV